jgi:hypothetical protein
MRNPKYLLAAAAMGGLLALPQTSSASPLGVGLAASGSTIPMITDGLVQKVHGWHCRKRKGWYHGHRVWHRHRRACYDYDYDDYDYYDYSYYPYYAYPFPFFSFHFDDDDDDFHGRHHFRGKRKFKKKFRKYKDSY